MARVGGEAGADRFPFEVSPVSEGSSWSLFGRCGGCSYVAPDSYSVGITTTNLTLGVV